MWNDWEITNQMHSQEKVRYYIYWKCIGEEDEAETFCNECLAVFDWGDFFK